MVPWQLYVQYGNTQIIEDNIEAMMAWLNGMDFYDFSKNYPHLSSKTGGLADWLAMDDRTPPDMLNNAIYIYMMEVTAYMAEATDTPTTQKYYGSVIHLPKQNGTKHM